ncbi:MAG: DUF4335 domain-containing protein [Limnothrix sp.]
MLSPTLIRRYTPPTCSLEITAKTSALSQWTGKPVVKDLVFELSLDDPRLVTEQKILLAGDRQQLEDLAEVVTDYVQRFLQQTSPVFDFAPTQNIFTYQTPDSNNVATIARPQLETKGLLSHRLHLGRLASNVSGQTIQLTATQLFDLANALDSYSADMVALPGITAARNRKNAIRWGAIAASVLLVVGVSKAVLQDPQVTQSESAVADLDLVAPIESEEQVIAPNPHSSYSFAPVPELGDTSTLTAKREDPAIANLKPIPRSGAQSNTQSRTTPRKTQTARPNTTSTRQSPPPLPPTIADSRPLPPGNSIPSAAGEYPVAAQANDLEALSESDGFATETNPPTASERMPVGSAPAPAPSGDRLQQAQQYFAKNWQTPDGLNETLEYRLTVDPSGKITKTIPLGKAAELYQSRLTFLAPEQTVTRTSTSTQLMRLVLDPDGTVQTFIETESMP